MALQDCKITKEFIKEFINHGDWYRCLFSDQMRRETLELLRQGHQWTELSLWVPDGHPLSKSDARRMEWFMVQREWISAIKDGQIALGARSMLRKLSIDFVDWSLWNPSSTSTPYADPKILRDFSYSMINIRELSINHSKAQSLILLAHNFIDWFPNLQVLIQTHWHYSMCPIVLQQLWPKSLFRLEFKESRDASASMVVTQMIDSLLPLLSQVSFDQ
jgi:hypothetical protein